MYQIGKSIYELETPALLLDLDKFQWNIDKMFKFAKESGVNVRPHAKTFKAAAICNKVLDAGAIGIMTQKLGEAEVLLNSGILYGDKNILISQEIADPAKTEKLVGLNVAMGEGKVLTAIENVEQAELLSKTASNWGVTQHVIIEMTQGRCGVAPGKPVVDLAKKVVSLKNLKFRGIYGYENPVPRETALERNKLTVDTANMIRDVGIEVEIVSAGSTGTYEVTGTYPGITEIEPGSFVFGAGEEGSGYAWRAVNDVFFKSSLSVLTQIIGANFSDRVVTDAGLKVMSAGNARATPRVKVRIDGEMLNLDEYENVGLSEEHGTIRFTPNNSVRKTLRWGQKIEFIPSHCCTCVNQHDNLYVVKDEKVAAIWPITARGKYY
ncbi:MAG: alanine racemase [Candidatus Bathyarchaeota archaeon]|nr:MAG: alanine racemase [Candidatus Bathyarchaeota archaeon]